MRETLAEVMTAGAFLLSPHPVDQPAAAEPAPHAEIVVDSESLAPAQAAQLGNLELTAAGSDPARYSVDFLRNGSDYALPPHLDTHHNVALPPEMFDPDTLAFWLEVVGGSLGLTGAGGWFTKRQLKRSLSRDHTAIKEEGAEAQAGLSAVLEAARLQANGLHDDDVPELRRLIAKYDPTSDSLLNALALTDGEYNAEYERFLALKRRLHKAPNTKLILKTTGTATKNAQTLQRELNRVRTDLSKIDDNLNTTDSTIASLQEDLDALTQKGWDLSAYEERATALVAAAEAARAKWAERYIDESTKITKTATSDALKLKEKVVALESRRAAADEAYGTQSGRIETAEATAVTIRGRFAKLQATYSEACLVDFENLQDELTEALAALTSTHETGSEFTGEQGRSVDAVKRSEKLNKSFDKTAEEIQTMETDLKEREEHLATLVEQLPSEIDRLSARFDKAMKLVDDPDVEDAAAVDIRALAKKVAGLTTSISTAEGQKPDYLDIEKRHERVAAELDQAHNAAKAQKQEMNDFRTEIPQRVDAYNNLLTALKDFAGDSKVRLHDGTRNNIARLRAYKHEMATDRQNLRKQHRYLQELIQSTHRLMKRAEEEAAEDSPLLATAKVAGGIALALIGGNIIDG